MTPPPQVTHIYPAYHRRGGVERFLWEVSRRQARLRPVRILTRDAEEPAGDAAQFPIQIERLRLPHWGAALRVLVFALRAAAQLSRWKRTSDTPFVSHTQGASSLGSDVITAQSCHKAWFKLSLASLSPTELAFWRKILNPVHYVTILIETLQYRPDRFQRVVGCAGCVKRELQEQYDIPPEKIDVIYNGVDPKEFKPTSPDGESVGRREALRASWGCPPDGILLLFAANEFRRKGLSTILEAMAQLKHQPFYLVVAGRDGNSPFLPLISKLGLEGRVRFLGPVRDMASYYAAGDIFVFPTKYEPFGMVVLEAMSSGLPVITTRLAGVAEIMHHGKDGMLMDEPTSASELASALTSLVSKETRSHMGHAARQSALALSWDNITAAYDHLYSLINPRHRD